MMFDSSRPFDSPELAALLKAMGIELQGYPKELVLRFAEGEFVEVIYRCATTPDRGKDE